jgi:4-amino-4-deoxy-L-arabinose transferase-like glycosyltransferase
MCGLLAVAIAYSIHLDAPALLDEPNDGQYAEVAREMVVRGDWVSPQLNFALFLNKPPLLYWLIAASYTQFGINEAAARVPGVLAALVTIVLVYALGTVLFDRVTGLSAAAVFAAMPSTFLEARLVRPDVLIMATTVAAIFAFVVALRTSGVRRTRALYAVQIALALGLLAKGMPALLLPAVPITAAILADRRWDVARTLLNPRSWWIFLALVVPWHLIVAVRHEGFLWDYVVNQHLLFFFDRKDPRDSMPASLGVFWAATMVRLFPWTVTVPLVLAFSIRQWRRCPPRRATFLVPLTWAAGTLGFFSAAASRLEHYSLPALPAIALLTAVTLRDGADAGAGWRAALRGHYVLMAGVFAAAAVVVARLLATDPWLSHAPALRDLCGPYFGVVAAGAAIAAVLNRRSPVAALMALAVACVVATPFIRRSLIALAPINSSAPVADAISRVSSEKTHIVFEAPVEYQSVAGLNFYLRRRVTLVRPPGFVEPTYLAPYRDTLFVHRARLDELWRGDDVVFVSDPLAPRERPVADVVPAPFSVVDRIGNRWIVRNR